MLKRVGRVVGITLGACAVAVWFAGAAMWLVGGVDSLAPNVAPVPTVTPTPCANCRVTKKDPA